MTRILDLVCHGIRLLCWVAAVAGVVACAPRPDPAMLKPDDATLIGSRPAPEGWLGQDLRVLVSVVDQKPTGHRRFDWDIPIRVAAGDHVIQVAAVQGYTTAEVVMRVTLEPGITYVARLRAQQPEHPAAIWLENSVTGASVSEISVFAHFD